MTEPVAFPTGESTERIVNMAIARGGRFRPADAGAICGFCVDADADVWVIADVATVDDFGAVTAVRLRNGKVRGLAFLWAVVNLCIVGDDVQFDLARIPKRLRWRRFSGALAMREALRPYLRVAV